MLSNRHFGKPEPKSTKLNFKANKTVQASAVMVAGREVVLALVDWEGVKGPQEINVTYAQVMQIFPGKNIVLVARDPLKYGQPAVFFGQPDLARLFEGRQIGDFRWTPVEYK